MMSQQAFISSRVPAISGTLENAVPCCETLFAVSTFPPWGGPEHTGGDNGGVLQCSMAISVCESKRFGGTDMMCCFLLLFRHLDSRLLWALHQSNAGPWGPVLGRQNHMGRISVTEQSTASCQALYHREMVKLCEITVEATHPRCSG